MDYEKKYKEALRRAKRLHSEPTGGTERIVCEQIFPELRESEDERIKKCITLLINGLTHEHFVRCGASVDEIKAWLEKQGVQKSTLSGDDKRMWKLIKKYAHYNISDMALEADHITREQLETWLEKKGEQKSIDNVEPCYSIGDIICDKSCTTLNKDAQPNMEIVDIKNGMYICDKGSFPVSQQDEYELVSKRIDTKLNDGSVSNELREASFAHAEKELKNQTFPDNLEFELIYTFEEGAKWNAMQHIHAWSEEEEEILDEIIDFLENGTVKLQHDLSLYASWLKSLKNRYAWKPSDAQMIALDDVITNGLLSNANERILKGLQEQLKKLK